MCVFLPSMFFFFRILFLFSYYDKLWVPDMFFFNEKKGYHHLITQPNIQLRLFPDGRVMLSQR